MQSIQASAVDVPVRPYQAEARDAVIRTISNPGTRSTAVLAATGTGKTRIAKSIVARYLAQGQRCLFLVNRDELVWQAQEAMSSEPWPLVCDVDKANRKAETWSDLVVASVQTLRQEERLSRYDRNAFGLIILDEAHETVSDSYDIISDWFASAKLVGFTATPPDPEAPARILHAWQKRFESVAYQMNMRRAIDEGWLVPVRQTVARIPDLDYSSLRRNSSEAQIDAVVNTANILRKMAEETIRLCEGRQAAIYTASVEHAYAFAKALRSLGATAETIEGDRKRLPMRRRREILDDVCSSRTQFVTNCQTLTTGVDIPALAAIVYARPMVSCGLYEQVAGRGARPLCAEELNALQFADPIERRMVIANSTKPDCLMVDFAGNHDRGLKLYRATWAVDRDIDDEIARSADEIARNENVDVNEAILHAESKTRVSREFDPRLIDAVQQPLTSPMDCDISYVDPFTGAPCNTALQLLGLNGIKYRPDMHMASPAQINVLKDLGICNGAEKLSRDHASLLITEIGRRRRYGLADLQQIHLLNSFGKLPAEKLRRITAERAERGLAQLRDNNWTRPDHWDAPRV